MDLVRERKLNYEINIVRDELEFQLLTVEFEAVDYSKIHAEIVVKKVNNKGFILEFPDYEEVPRSFLGLMNYYALGYSAATLHIRGDRGRSENKQPASIYFPFLNNNNREDLYYNYAYQDGIDFVNILKREFPTVSINVYSGQDWFVNTLDKWVQIEANITGESPKVTSITDFIREEHTLVHKLLLIDKADTIQKLQNTLSIMDFPQTDFYLSKDNYLEVTHNQVSKKQALLKACLESWLCQLFLLITLRQEKTQEIVKSQNQDNGHGQKLIET